MPPDKPSLDLLRCLSDEHVLRALMDEPRCTRAALAARTGISKPTISQSVRRLTEAGLLVDTGLRTTGRGRAGSYYALADVGRALVVSIAPSGIVAESVDCHGDVRARTQHPVGRPARPAEVAGALESAATDVLTVSSRPPLLAVVSAADPVDRATGRLVHLPDAPFLLGELSPVDVLAPLVAGPVLVDNDVNWAARTELTDTEAALGGDVAYVHLGEGLGCAIISDGAVRRGHAGLAGEIAHLVTTGPGGRAMPFTRVFAELALRRPGTTAVDVASLRRAVRLPAGEDDVGSVLGRAVAGVLTAIVALADPAAIVLGGAWGRDPAVLDAVCREMSRQARHVQVRAARAVDEPSLAGARSHALQELRSAVIAMARAS